jgi:F-type H+-transporting ATPase subunit epsilon
MKLTIITPEGNAFEGEVTMVSVPGELGPFEILKGHAPIISTLKKGTIRYVSAGNSGEQEIVGGFVEVSNNNIEVCAELPIA